MKPLLLLAMVSLVHVACGVSLFRPLTNPPRAEQVAAFCNEPGDSYRVRKLIAKEDLLLFLREGQAITDRDEIPRVPQNFDYESKGVFFTVDGAAFQWSLESPSVLRVHSPDFRTCWFVLRGKRVAVTDPVAELKPPKAAEVMGFGNEPGNDASLSFPLEKAAILRFLAEGQTGIPREEWARLREASRITVPASASFVRERIASLGKEFANGRVSPSVAGLWVKGAFSTQSGAVFYWELWDDRLLHLQAVNGPECLIRLP